MDVAILWALELESGKEIWHWNGAGEIRSDPSVAHGVIYVGVGYPGNLYALESDDGKRAVGRGGR